LSLLQPAALLSEVRVTSRFTQQCCHLQLLFRKTFIMKTSRIAALALIATAAAGFNAYAEGVSYQADFTQQTASTLTRAQVQAEANANRAVNGLYTEVGEARTQATPSVLTREAVRAEAVKSRSVNLLPESIG
jgi:hypothetical protein